MQWFYANELREQVALDEEGLKNLVHTGKIGPDTLVWNENLPDWRPCRDVSPDWFTSTALALSPATLASRIDPTPPLPYQMGPPPSTDGLALASLVCGISGLITSPCYGLGFPLSIAAVICGHLCRRRLLREGNLSSAGLAMAGLVTGYLVIVLVGAFWMIVGLVAVFAAVAA